MPITKANKDKYPANWSEIRAQVLRRAGGQEDDPRVGARCERCLVRNYAIGFWEHGQFQREVGNIYWDDYHYAVSHQEAREAAAHCNDFPENGRRRIVIVLTIAHVHDHTPENCALENLQALCQRCHNQLDIPLRRKNAAQTRREKRSVGQGDMFV